MRNCDGPPQPCYFSNFDKFKDVDHTIDIRCCSICDKWMCISCRPMYNERMKAAMHEQKEKFKQKALAFARSMKARSKENPPKLV